MANKVLYYKDIAEGQEFKPYVYTLTEDTILKYCKAVEESCGVFTDPKVAKADGYKALAAPPTTAAIYALKGFLGEVDMPGGSLHATQEFDFVTPAVAGDVLTTTSKVLKKAVKNGRNHATIEAVTTNQDGKVIVRSRMGAIWAE